jgi:hypothetical protein
MSIDSEVEHQLDLLELSIELNQCLEESNEFLLAESKALCSLLRASFIS